MIAISLAAAVAALAASQAAAPTGAAGVSEAQAAALLVAQRCASCHSADLVAQQRLTPPQWTASVEKMRRWGAVLSDAEVALLARQLAARQGVDAPPQPPRTIRAAEAAAALAPLPDGPFASGSAALGRELLAARCARCHGEDARGGTPGVNLVDRPVLRRAQEFAATVRTGRGLMPPYPLDDREVAALLAYLRSLR